MAESATTEGLGGKNVDMTRPEEVVEFVKPSEAVSCKSGDVEMPEGGPSEAAKNPLGDGKTPNKKSAGLLCKVFSYKTDISELKDVVEDEEDNMEDKKDEVPRFHEDCYSFMALGWGNGNLLPFLYGFFVFLMQVLFLILMICSKAYRPMSANEDVDNPGSDGFSGYMPANASLVVRTTQFASAIAFIIFAEDSINDVMVAVKYFPIPFYRLDHGFVTLACSLRFLQGMLACYTVFLLVMTSEDVIDIVLNFTAVNFISNMDDNAFELAASGRYGHTLKKKAEDIQKKITVNYKCLLHVKDETVITATEKVDVTYKWYLPTISVIAVFLFSFFIYVVVQQEHEGVWEAKTFYVQFEDELSKYSGCFQTDGNYTHRRAVYKSFSQQDSAVLEYCKAERRWIFYKKTSETSSDDFLKEDCNPGENGLAQSAKTNVFSVTSAFELDWLSISTESDPYQQSIEVSFTPGDVSSLFCGLKGDGKCDDELNDEEHDYDGGDCCGQTCTNNMGNICGTNEVNEVIEAFGHNLTYWDDDAIGFPSCEDPEFDNEIDITLDLTSITHFEEDEECWKPTLKLECGEEKKTIFSIPISGSMLNKQISYNDIKLREAEVCDLTAIDFEQCFGDNFSLNNIASFKSEKNMNVDLVFKMVKMVKKEPRKIPEILCQDEEYQSMCELMRNSGNAEDILFSDSTWTVFAPSNDGFARYYEENDEPPDFWFHIVKKVYSKEDLEEECQETLKMQNDKDSRTMCTKDIPTGQKGAGNVNASKFIDFDIPARNGAIHTIEDVLLY